MSDQLLPKQSDHQTINDFVIQCLQTRLDHRGG
jgi:hypothetical protein